MQIEQDKLKSENTSLLTAFRDKNRKHQQTMELYDRLKRKEMAAATKSAAYESVNKALGSISGQQDQIHQTFTREPQPMPGSDRPSFFGSLPLEMQNEVPSLRGDGLDQIYEHGRSTIDGRLGNGGAMPPQAAKEYTRTSFNSSKFYCLFFLSFLSNHHLQRSCFADAFTASYSVQVSSSI